MDFEQVIGSAIAAEICRTIHSLSENAFGHMMQMVFADCDVLSPALYLYLGRTGNDIASNQYVVGSVDVDSILCAVMNRISLDLHTTHGFDIGDNLYAVATSG